MAGSGLGRLRPFAPAVTVESIGPEPAPERGATDAEALRRLPQWPAVLVEGADDGLALALGEGRGAGGTLDEHRFPQVEVADPERLQPPPQLGQRRHQVGGRTAQVELQLPGLGVGVDDFPVGGEYDDALAEGIEERLGKRGKDRGERGRVGRGHMSPGLRTWTEFSFRSEPGPPPRPQGGRDSWLGWRLAVVGCRSSIGE